MFKRRRFIYLFLKYKLSIVAILTLAICISVWVILCYNAPRNEAYRSLIRVDACYHYELSDGQHKLLEWGHDTVVNSGCWESQMALIPSCKGRFIAVLDEAPEHNRYKNITPAQILKVAKDSIDSVRHDLKGQLMELNYYERSHDVTDEGFEVIKKFSLSQQAFKDHLDQVSEKLSKINTKAPLKVEYKVNYIAIYRDGSGLWKSKKANLLEKVDDEGAYLLQTEDSIKPDFAESQPRSLAIRLSRMMSTTQRHSIDFSLRRDSAGFYTGETNRQFLPHGHGKHFDRNGAYYEGHWEHGKRNGFGFAIGGKKPLRVGEWQNDVYRGERLVYSSERIYGIDISKYQHVIKRKKYSIDWDNLRITSLGKQSKKRISGQVNYTIQFIYIKSTEGASILNPYYSKDYVSAKQHGYRVGTYHFFSTTSPVKKQVAQFLKRSHLRKGDLPPVLDVEPSPAQIKKMGGDTELFARVRLWLRLVEQATGTKPILYISQMFVNHHLKHAPDLKHNYQVWIARYGEYKPDIHLAIWQLGQDGRVNGIKGEVDIDVFNGYKSSYEEFLKTHTIK